MDRLISEQAVLKAVSKGCCELRGVYARCEEGIKAIPSAEPKTGHWIERRNKATGHIESVCSECGAEEGYPYNDYCGNCGARNEYE